MPQPAEVAHHIPGRLRLRLQAAKGNTDALQKVRRSIAAMPGVTRVTVRSTTGSIVVNYRRASALFLEELSAMASAAGYFDLIQIAESDNDIAGVSLRTWAGRSLLAFGVAGVLLPVIPGTPFLIAGAALLGPRDPIVSRGLTIARKLKPIKDVTKKLLARA